MKNQDKIVVAITIAQAIFFVAIISNAILRLHDWGEAAFWLILFQRWEKQP